MDGSTSSLMLILFSFDYDFMPSRMPLHLIAPKLMVVRQQKENLNRGVIYILGPL